MMTLNGEEETSSKRKGQRMEVEIADRGILTLIAAEPDLMGRVYGLG